MTAPQAGEIQVEDQLERRIHKPVDLLRCVVSCTGIAALVLAGIAASAIMACVAIRIRRPTARIFRGFRSLFSLCGVGLESFAGHDGSRTAQSRRWEARGVETRRG